MTSTHTVEFVPAGVRKTYRSWDRDEPLREATALRHLAVHAPDLAPQLIETGVDERPPWITMSRLPGETILRPWTVDELDRLGRSLERLWAVPSAVLPPLPGSPAHRIAFWQARFGAQPPPEEPELRAVHDRVGRWLVTADAARLDRLASPPVLGHGDPRVDNLLVDGTAVRLIDLEDAGRSHRPYELANTIEHLGNRGLGFEALVDLDAGPGADLLLCRRLIALFWFLLLDPAQPAAARNPPGTRARQAARLDRLLG